MNDDQQAVQRALIEQNADEVVAGVTGDKQAVAIEVGDTGAYFSPAEVREMNKSIASELGDDGLTDGLRRVMDYVDEHARVVEGEKTMEEVAEAFDDDVTVTFPEDDADE